MESYKRILNNLPLELVFEVLKFLPRNKIREEYFESKYFENKWNNIHQKIVKTKFIISESENGNHIYESLYSKEDDYLIYKKDTHYMENESSSSTTISKFDNFLPSSIYDNFYPPSKIEYKKSFGKFRNIYVKYRHHTFITISFNDDNKIIGFSKHVRDNRNHDINNFHDYDYHCFTLTETLNSLDESYHDIFKGLNIKYTHSKSYDVKKHGKRFTYAVNYFFHGGKKIIFKETFEIDRNQYREYIYMDGEKILNDGDVNDTDYDG
ncbi:MAG: hypothetical protein BGO27_03600 [Alphaproteobacteria bacterium 33-17]|nr:MAG: hypothetical protein BGO27_03600 [Alphaproteobacteria bacterium 33-17]